MRYYAIAITNEQKTPFTIGNFKSYDSQKSNGQSITGALNVELDLPVTVYAIAENSASVRIWGISLDDIGPASNMVGMTMDVWGGMQKGLPLANPKQAGKLLHGVIQQCYSNWIGTAMTLDFVVMADTGKNSSPSNIILDWPAGQTMQNALKKTLSTAFPAYEIKFNLEQNPTLPQAEYGYYATLWQFANFVKNLSIGLVNVSGYLGVDIVINDNVIIVSDNAKNQTVKKISFFDMIGQPAWIEPGIIQLICCMRGDLAIGDILELPASPVITTQQSLSQYPQLNRNGSIFQGKYRIKKLRHYGNFRSANALDWITTIDCYKYA